MAKNLFKKIGTALAIGALASGLSGCAILYEIRLKEYNDKIILERRMEEKRQEERREMIREEAKRYNFLFVNTPKEKGDNRMWLGWNRKKDQLDTEDFRAEYEKKQICMNSLYNLQSKAAWEDRDLDNLHSLEIELTKEELEKDEASKITLIGITDWGIGLGMDRNNDGFIDKIYNYEKIRTRDENPSFKLDVYELYNIQEDRNENRQMEKDETIWSRRRIK